MKCEWIVVAVLVSASVFRAEITAAPAEADKKGVLGLETVIAFYGNYPELKSQTFARNADWKDLQKRGGVASQGTVHHQFLQKSAEEASDYLAALDFGDNPVPLIDIDEFGWDYDGGIDHHCMDVLKATHAKRPELNIAVWQMRGPVAPKLAEVYRDTVALVMLETYFDLTDAWMIPFQLQAARLTGLLDRSVIALGLGKESLEKGDQPWTRTEKELDQQIRLIRFVAPESPGVAFFGKWKLKENECALTDEQLDRICEQFREIPIDGSGLEPELLALGQIFTRCYEKPALFCSSEFVLPYFHSGHDGRPWGRMREPETARVLLMNLGQQAAEGVKVRVRKPGEAGEVWAAGDVDVPARSLMVAPLPVLPGKGFSGWIGTEILEVEAPGVEVYNFVDSRFHDVKKQ